MRLQHLLPHQFHKAIEDGWPLLVPVGCIEYHGPHMALGCDTILTEELMVQVAKRLNVIVAPPLWYGPTGYAVSGPDQGTMDVSTERFGRHVKDVLTSFWKMGFKWIVVVIHHQGLDGPEALAIRQAAAEVTFEQTLHERGNAWWGKAPLPPKDNVFERIQILPSVLPAAAAQGIVMADHAGFYETALLMAAFPAGVELNRLGNEPPWFSSTENSQSRAASLQAGEQMWAKMISAWVEQLAPLVRQKRPTPNEVTISGLF